MFWLSNKVTWCVVDNSNSYNCMFNRRS